MNTKDFAPDLAGDQTLDVYTVAYNVSPTSDGGALLINAGTRGGGVGYFGAQAEQLTDALTNAMVDIIEKSSQSFASASVPASRTSAGDNFYATYFEPSDSDPLWAGHLKAFQINGAGDILDASGYCLNASVSNQSPPCNTTGQLRQDSAPDFWDAAEEIPAPASRTLYFGEDIAPYQRPTTFTAANVDETDLQLVSGDASITEYNPLGSSPPTLGELADYIVDFFRGCELGTLIGTDCATRATQLGDIFHSDPTVVGPPRSPINEGSYKTFANNKRYRDRVIYAGANDGFLHAFDAGFMPWNVLNHAKDLAPNPTVPHTFYGPDGPMTVADVWLYRNFSQSGNPPVPAATMDQKTADQWRTVLIGGLRQSGGGYYALDITTPGASDYPGYMWEIGTRACRSP
jgi:type IV pilus assembly protein PilY1